VSAFSVPEPWVDCGNIRNDRPSTAGFGGDDQPLVSLNLDTHGHGVVASLLLGAVAEGMVRKAEVPTMIIPVKKKE